jgi:hypothetical protein
MTRCLMCWQEHNDRDLFCQYCKAGLDPGMHLGSLSSILGHRRNDNFEEPMSLDDTVEWALDKYNSEGIDVIPSSIQEIQCD